MKATKIMDSLNYLDDDLLLESEMKNVAKITPLNDKKKISAIKVLSIAASFILVSFIVLALFASVSRYFRKADEAANDVHTHGEEIQSIVGVQDSNGEWYSDSPELAPETDAADEEIEEEPDYQIFVVFDSELYYLSETGFNPEIKLRPLGEVEETNLDEYIGCQIYAYEENSIIVELDGEYMLFEKAE